MRISDWSSDVCSSDLLRTALSPSAFDPGTADRRFTIAAGSYFCALFIPGLLARARQIAPNVSFRIQPLGGDLLVDLDGGAIDLALGVSTKIPRRLRLERLEDHPSELLSLMRFPIVVFCFTN